MPLDNVRGRQEHQARKAQGLLSCDAHLAAELFEQIIVDLERALSRACMATRERLGGRWISHDT